MKTKTIATVLLIAFILASCAPATTIVPTETTAPTSTVTPVPPTQAITPTSTPIPIIDVEGQTILDPHFSNPELFDLEKSYAPIPQFVHALKIAGINVSAQNVSTSLTYKAVKTQNGDTAVLLLTTDLPETSYDEGNIPLFIYSKYLEKLEWKAVTITNIDSITNRHSGTQLGHDQLTGGTYNDIYLEGLSKVADFVTIDGQFNLQLLLPNGGEIKIINMIQNAEDLSGVESLFHWEYADPIVKYANTHGLGVQGHHILWHVYLTDGIKNGLKDGSITYDQYEQFLKLYTQTLVKHYDQDGLKINEWSVANEIAGGMLWMDPDGIMSKLVNERHILTKVFKWVKEVDPNIKTIMNEAGFFDRLDERQSFMKVMKQALADGAPIDEIGLQNHMWVYSFPSESTIEQSMTLLKTLNLPVSSTEITVSISDTDYFSKANPKQKNIKPEDLVTEQARDYALLYKYIQNNATFGYTDAISMFDQNGDPTANAMMFDKQIQPKIIYYEIIKTIFELFKPN